MRFSATRLALALGALATITLVGPATLSAQDFSGEWMLEVTTDTGVTTPTLVLMQDGEALTGHYTSETLGEADVEGTVEGSEFTVMFEADLQGQAIPVTYKGEMGEDGTLSGTLDLGGGMLTGTFKATKK